MGMRGVTQEESAEQELQRGKDRALGSLNFWWARGRMALTQESEREKDDREVSNQQPLHSLMTSLKVISEVLRMAWAGHSGSERNARGSEKVKFSM